MQDWLNALEATGSELHSVMVARFGQVCAEGWWHPYGPQLIHGMQSLSKTYAVTALGALHDEGLLSLDEPIVHVFADYLPPNPGERLRRMTVRHLLCMAAFDRPVDMTLPDWIRRFLAQPISDEPGTAFHYNGLCTALGAAIIREKTGLELIDYMTPRIFDRIGIDGDRVRSIHMGDGLEYAGGGLFTTTEDNLRLMMLYLNRGLWQGERVLSEEWCREVTTRQIATASEEAHNPGVPDNYKGYGLQCWMCQPEGVYRADGAMGQFCIVDPSRDLVISITETADLPLRQHQRVLETVWDVLLPGITQRRLPENPDARNALLSRLRGLSLPRPVYTCTETMAKDIQDKTWQLPENDLLLLPGMTLGAIGREQAGVQAIRLHFADDTAELSWLQNHKPMHIHIGLTGFYTVNKGCYGPAKLHYLLALGGWREPRVFEMHLRMVETCFSACYTLSIMEDGTLRIDCRGTGAQPGGFSGTVFPISARLMTQKENSAGEEFS